MSVHLLPPLSALAPVVFEDERYYAPYAAEKTPIVIDNGATDFRYGFATASRPFTSANAMAKYKDRKTNAPLLLFGDAVEADAASRLATKYTWEGDILASPDALEAGLDFAFLRMGISMEAVAHPVVMSERLATPLASRALCSELLFECYTAPSVAYCIDAPLSHYYNRRNAPHEDRDGLVLSFNTSSTSIIPILGGKGILSHAKRLPWGGAQAAEYLTKLLSLKYPSFGTKLTTQHTNWMVKSFCSFSPSYLSTLRSLGSPAGMSAADVVIQFPFTAATGDEKTDEQLAQLAEKRREAGRRLQDQAAKNRAEKLSQQETDLAYLLDIKSRKEKEKRADFLSRLRAEGIESESLLDEDIKRLENSLKRARKKEELTGKDEPDETTEEPTFPLVDIPDGELTEEQIKEKRKQRLAKAGYEARIRARKEKEKEREAKEALEQQEQRERDANPIAWAAGKRAEHAAVMDRIKDRAKRRAALTDRKSAASQTRMKNIASLADEQPVTKKRKKTTNEDMFGQNDSDWAIYNKINLDNASDDEEEDFLTLASLESALLTHDPSFSYDHTFEGIATHKSALMSAFCPKYPEGDTEGASRLHLNVERWRVPETWFGPGMAGIDAAGLGELVESVLKSFKEDERRRLVKDIFLTGGPCQIPGLADRLLGAIRPILAPETPINVSVASDPRLDAWNGMAAFARTPDLADVSVTREEYLEWGGERIKRWWGGNWNSAF